MGKQTFWKEGIVCNSDLKYIKSIRARTIKCSFKLIISLIIFFRAVSEVETIRGKLYSADKWWSTIIF